MAVIRIDSFGGEMPSASSRNIPITGARRAFNLLARVNEFRPVDSDVVKRTKAQAAAAGQPFVEDGQFLYRFKIDSSGNPITSDVNGWVTAAAPLNYVNGQINDSATERVYVSTLDGSAAPIVIDATGVSKPLGVPAPATAPLVTHTTVNEYSTDEDTAARAAIPLALFNATRAALSVTPIGNAPTGAPSSTVPGVLAHGTTGVTGTLPSANAGEWNFLLPMSGGVLLNTTVQFLTAIEFGGAQVVYGGVTYWAIPLALQGLGYSVDADALATAVKAIVSPDTGEGQLIPDAQATSVAAGVAGDFAQTAAPQVTSIAALSAARLAFDNALGGTANRTTATATLAAFYADTAVAAAIAAADAGYVENVFNFLTYYLGASIASPTTLRNSIIAHIQGAYTANAQGLKNLDATALTTWTVAQFTTYFSSQPGLLMEFTSYVGSSAANLAAYLSESGLRTQFADKWPGTTSLTTQAGDQSSAISAAIMALRSAARRVTADYEVVVARTADNISTIFDAGIAPLLPTPVPRLVDTRFYVTTLVTEWGEESAPSLPSEALTVDQNDICAVPRPAELGNATAVALRKLVGWRIYRTNQATDGAPFREIIGKSTDEGAVFINGFFSHWNKTLTSLSDSKLSTELGGALATTTWLPPPVQSLPSGIAHATPYLRGMTSMANGVTAGFFDNMVCFSEPFVPYAWPVEYQVPTKHKVVGMGAFGQSLFVGTTGTPYLISGADSASMSAQELPGNQSCVSARSIASVENGVLYASPDGICLADYSGVKNLTQTLFTRDDWAYINPASIVGAMHHGVYYFLYTNRVAVVPIDPASIPGITTVGSYDPALVARAFTALAAGLRELIWNGSELEAKAVYNHHQATYGFTDVQFAPYVGYTAAQVASWKSNQNVTPVGYATGQWGNRIARPDGCYALDFVTGKLTELDVLGTAFYLDVTTDTLYLLDGTDIKALFVDATIKRKGEYWTGVIKLDAPASFAWLQVDAVFTRPAVIKWYGDGVLRHTAEVSNNTPVRLPSGRYLEHQIMIESFDRITRVTLAGSTQELKSA